MVTKESIITSDRLFAALPDVYHKMDVFYSGGRSISWRGRVCRAPPQTERLIVTGHSDFPLVDELLTLYPRATWWGTNKQTPRARGIPLGITNATNESDIHPIYGDLDSMVEVAKTPRTIKNLVYMNFSVDTYPRERRPVWDMFASAPWVTVGSHVPTHDGRRTFLTDLRNHSFVLCPRGNGVDTHRLWETLYMGSIPIVKWDIAHSDWTDLPILFVSSWDEVTEDRLRAEEVRIRSSSWNLAKLDVNYWIRAIQSSTVRVFRGLPIVL
jgi:hypothetical protein